MARNVGRHQPRTLEEALTDLYERVRVLEQFYSRINLDGYQLVTTGGDLVLKNLATGASVVLSALP